MSITPDVTHSEIVQQIYQISVHTDDERLADGLTVSQREVALSRCEVLESYPDDPRGESCLVLGFTPEGSAAHMVCGRNRSGHLVLITVYPQVPAPRHTRPNNGLEPTGKSVHSCLAPVLSGSSDPAFGKILNKA